MKMEGMEVKRYKPLLILLLACLILDQGVHLASPSIIPNAFLMADLFLLGRNMGFELPNIPIYPKAFATSVRLLFRLSISSAPAIVVVCRVEIGVAVGGELLSEEVRPIEDVVHVVLELQERRVVL